MPTRRARTRPSSARTSLRGASPPAKGPPRGRIFYRSAVPLAGVSEPAAVLRPFSLKLFERCGQPERGSGDEDSSSASSEEVPAQPAGRGRGQGRGRGRPKAAAKKAVRKAPASK